MKNSHNTDPNWVLILVVVAVLSLVAWFIYSTISTLPAQTHPPLGTARPRIDTGAGSAKK